MTNLFVYFAVFLISSVIVLSQDLQWTRMAGTSGADAGQGIAVDSDGSVYVTGYAQGSLHDQTSAGNQDILFMKYSSNGTRVWTRLVGTAGTDQGYGVAVDHAGYLYVTGFASGSIHGEEYSGGGGDVVLMKYSTNGTWIWTKMTGSTTSEVGAAVAVDTAGGFVYVAGNTDASSLHGQTNAGSIDIFLMQFSTNGTRIWTQLVGGAGDDVAYSMALDYAGFAYVAGQTYASVDGEAFAGVADLILVKFASDGSKIWTRLAGSSEFDFAWGVAVDALNSAVYLIGTAYEAFDGQTSAGGPDIALMKYHTNGTKIWTKLTGSLGSDAGYGIAVDDTGAIFLTGFVESSLHGQSVIGTGPNIFLMEYASNGTRIWTRLLGSSTGTAEQGYAVGVYGTGSIYVTGVAQGSISDETYVLGDDLFVASYENYQPPSISPTFQPVITAQQPTALPTSQPSSRPSAQPSTTHPSIQPTGQPTSHPTETPDKTVCRYRTFRQVGGQQGEIRRHRCILVPGGSTSSQRRRLAASNADASATTATTATTVTAVNAARAAETETSALLDPTTEHHHAEPPQPSSPSSPLLSSMQRDIECPFFSMSGTAHTANAYQDADYRCQFTACPGDRVRVSLRPADGGSCSGFPVLRLVEGAGDYFPSNNGEMLGLGLATAAFADGTCPVLIYDFRDLAQCRQYTAVQGCEESSSCSGQATVHYLASP